MSPTIPTSSITRNTPFENINSLLTAFENLKQEIPDDKLTSELGIDVLEINFIRLFSEHLVGLNDSNNTEFPLLDNKPQLLEMAFLNVVEHDSNVRDKLLIFQQNLARKIQNKLKNHANSDFIFERNKTEELNFEVDSLTPNEVRASDLVSVNQELRQTVVIQDSFLLPAIGQNTKQVLFLNNPSDLYAPFIGLPFIQPEFDNGIEIIQDKNSNTNDEDLKQQTFKKEMQRLTKPITKKPKKVELSETQSKRLSTPNQSFPVNLVVKDLKKETFMPKESIIKNYQSYAPETIKIKPEQKQPKLEKKNTIEEKSKESIFKKNIKNVPESSQPIPVYQCAQQVKPQSNILLVLSSYPDQDHYISKRTVPNSKTQDDFAQPSKNTQKNSIPETPELEISDDEFLFAFADGVHVNPDFFKTQFSPDSQRILSLKMLLDLISDFYVEKTTFDAKSSSEKRSRISPELFLYDYLKKKYGLHDLVMQWAFMVVESVNFYATRSSEVALFKSVYL